MTALRGKKHRTSRAKGSRRRKGLQRNGGVEKENEKEEARDALVARAVLSNWDAWWDVGLRTEDRRADAKKGRNKNLSYDGEEEEAKTRTNGTTSGDGGGGDGDVTTEGGSTKKNKSINLLEFVEIMFDLLKPYKGMLAFGIVALFAAAGTELVLPHFTAKTIFSIQKGNAQTFYECVKTLLALAVAYSITASARGMTFGFLNQRFVYLLRCKLFENLLKQDITFHDQADVGVLTSRLTSDCSSMSRILGMNINLLIRNVFKTIGGAVYLWILSPQFFGYTALSLGLILLINFSYGVFSRKAAATEQEQLALGNQIATEVLTLIRTVRIFGTEVMERNKYVKSLNHLLKIGSRQIVAYGMFLTSASFLVNTTNAVCLLLGGMKCLRGEITAEQLTTFLFYTQFVVESALASSEQVANINTAVGSSERVLLLLKRRPNEHLLTGETTEEEHEKKNVSDDEPKGKVQLDDFKGHLELRNVNFRYPDLNAMQSEDENQVGEEKQNGEQQKNTLTDINLSLRPGTVTALVGPSGGGKSTLVSLLQYLYQPTSGTILADGVPIDELDVTWYRSQIGYVEQEPKLFDLPVGENIGYGSRLPGKEGAEAEGEGKEHPVIDVSAVEKAARDANALEFIERLPDRLETWIGNSSLSGGQRQRVALARALIRSPKILILDEATSALDAKSEFEVQKALDEVFNSKEKVSVLIIAHRMKTIQYADSIVVLKDGRIVESGSHKELMCMEGGTYRSLLKYQQPDLAPHCDPPAKEGNSKSFDEFDEDDLEGALGDSRDSTDVLA